MSIDTRDRERFQAVNELGRPAHYFVGRPADGHCQHKAGPGEPPCDLPPEHPIHIPAGAEIEKAS